MTETETILKLLEAPESDNDETNARIWCFQNNEKFVAMVNHVCSPCFEIEKSCGVWTAGLDFVSSLDAAMGIGAEELKGWVMDMSTLGQAWIQPFEAFHTTKFEAINLPNMPRAIAHARIQALAYVRGL